MVSTEKTIQKGILNLFFSSENLWRKGFG